MEKNNKKKRDQLGMPYGTACGKLRKQILFSLLCELRRDICYRCRMPILTIDDLSIEHKEPWLDSDNPKGNFFDLDNIAFSHLSCNVGAGKRYRGPEAKHGTRQRYEKWGCRCPECLTAKQRHNGLRKERGYR